MVHEDTLEAIERVCNWVEEQAFTRCNRWDGDTAKSCIGCDKAVYFCDDGYGHTKTPEDQRHSPECELVAKVTALRAFVRVERALR